MARRYHVGSGVPQDDSQSVAWLNKAADLGHTEAQYAMAVRYFNGTGVPQDYLHCKVLVHQALLILFVVVCLTLAIRNRRRS